MKYTTIKSPGKNSINLYKKSKVGNTQSTCLYGIALEKGYGNYITDVDGNTYLDFLSGAGSNTIGYGREDVVDVYAKTAKRLQHSCFSYSLNKDAVELADKLIDITPGNFDKKVLFGMSGSYSIDGAIKASRKFTGKKGIISFNNCYHGTTGFAIQATDIVKLTDGLFVEDKDFYHVPFPINKEYPKEEKEEKEEEISNILSKIEILLRQNSIAAFLVESIQGDAGVLIPPKDFFNQLYNLLKEYDVLFITDEIQTGAGRTGKWWGIEHFEVIPDIIVCGKGISGGYAPLSAVIGDEKIIDSLDKTQHSVTYEGHPPSCAVTKKVITIIEEEKLMENASKLGKLFINELKKLNNYKIVKDFRGIGLMHGLELNGESLAGIAGMRCTEYGLYPGYFGKNNDVLRIQPPLTLTEDQAKWGIEIIKKVVEELENHYNLKQTIEIYTQYSRGGLI